MINYITGKNNERTDVFSKSEQNVPETDDDKLEYKMAQLLKPGMLNFRKIEIDQPETLNFIGNQSIATGKNGVQKPENELENLWATAKNNDDVYQSVVGVIKKENEYYLRFWFSKFLSVIVR